MSAPNASSNFEWLCEEYNISLLKFIFSSEAIYAICALEKEDDIDKFILTKTGLIAGSHDPAKYFYRLIGDDTLQVPNRGDTLSWATEALKLVIEPTDVFDLNSLIIRITNHGLNKDTIQRIVYFMQLVNTHRYQTDHRVLGNLLTIPSLKAIQHIYSEYIFWDNIPRSVTFEKQLNQVNLYQFVVDLKLLVEAFASAFEVES
ncbi:hypothetical protein ACSX1A_00585 [Pontibacter sp. MBLB2868]|uniref:hypothetical protein n=1 Tax=Pontibacter sp. MBLB2868 TaxID=3451555 RepID=UPI003F74BCD2